MIATIVRIEGNVQVQRADGSIETLAVGDQLFEGDVVLTPEDGFVVLEYENNEQVLLTEGVELAITREQMSDESVDDSEFVASEDSVDDIISLLDETDGDLLEQFEATAAGNVASGGNTGSNFVRLSRALENVYDTPVGLTPVDINRPQSAESDITQPDFSGVSGGTISVNAEYAQGTSGLTVTGTVSNLPAGATVSLLLTDSQGNQLTTSTTIDANGDYSVSGVDLTGLTDGDVTVEASVVDATGATLTDSTSVEIDEVQGNLTVDVTTDGGVLTASGTSADLAEGTEVTVTITDANGNTITATAIVDADGNYTVDADVSGLTDGEVSVDVTATDNNGTEQTATDTAELDNVAGDLTVDSSVTDGSITVSGTSADMPEGTEVSITITDQNDNAVTTTATITADGSYTVNADVSSLIDGVLTINAVANDNNGIERTDSTDDILDTTAPGDGIDDNNSIAFG
ncbi:retention module-containing protein, partial [Idiomarina piscisalsi]